MQARRFRNSVTSLTSDEVSKTGVVLVNAA